jgi:20S proteasome subunit beta 1
VSIRSTELNQPPMVKTAAALFQQLCYENKDRLMAGIIIGGWDPVHKASLYSIPLGGACVQERYAIGGSGSSYIYGYCDANFREGMSRQEAIDFVTKGSTAFTLKHENSFSFSSSLLFLLVSFANRSVARYGS